MTKRRCSDVATLPTPLGSSVTAKSRLDRYFDSLRSAFWAMIHLRPEQSITVDAEITSAFDLQERLKNLHDQRH